MTDYALCRLTLSVVWLYQGLVPKLLGPHADELAMNQALGLSEAGARVLARGAGIAEVAFAILLLVCWRQRWPLQVSAVAMVGLLGFVVWAQPSLLLAAFNPVSTNIASLALSVVAWRLHASAAGAD